MKSWSLNLKIWSVIFLLAAAYVGSTGMSLQQLSSVRDKMVYVTGPVVRTDQLTSELKDNMRLTSVFALSSLVINDDEMLKANAKSFADVRAKQAKDLAELEKIATKDITDYIAAYRASYEKFAEGMTKVIELGSLNKNDEGGALFLQTRKAHIGELNKALDEIEKTAGDQLTNATADANAVASRAIAMSIVTALASISACLLIAFVTLRSLKNSIATVVNILSESSTQVTSAASQIASASQQLSQATTEQAASLEETAASVEEMNAMVAKNSENASASATTSVASQTRANEGKQTVGKMTDSMTEISRSNDNIMSQITAGNQSMADIVKVIEQIDKKTKVINEIVNKTELLSFNASVEAARAGEHGKGFAVVAEEVGNLARMSGAAAEEIGNLLEQSITKVNQTVAETKSSVERLMNDGKRIVESGVQVAHACGEVFDEVAQNVSTLSGKAKEIASASQEQSRGCAEITKAMSQLDQMTQQNAATSEECAAAAEQLSAQAESLKNAVVQLVVTVNGASQQAAPVKPALAKVAPAARPAARNVVHLKKRTEPTPKLAKAAGDAPDYDSDGFRDI